MIADTLNAPGNLAQAGLAFDTLAANYDTSFTRTHIGRAQRSVVWQEASRIFAACPSILELNCGTGEDALFLAARGHSVTAIDASREMIACATRRKHDEAPTAPIALHCLPIESLATLPGSWDAIFSNFSGLNCVDDLPSVAAQIALRVPAAAPALLCFSTRFCVWETLWYLLTLKPRKAFRRWSGHAIATLNTHRIAIHYPTLGEIERAFAPHLKLVAATGMGILVPPSYLEPWFRRHSELLAVLRRLDAHICRIPGIRSLGDHILLHFVRAEQS
jgi:SAM-dependent methyltransferase